MSDIRRLDTADGPEVRVLSLEREGYVRVQVLRSGIRFETKYSRLQAK